LERVSGLLRQGFVRPEIERLLVFHDRLLFRSFSEG